MNPILENIAEKAAEDLKDLIKSGSEDILTAIHKMQAEAQLQETSPKFNLGFKITVDFDKSTFDCDLSWSLKQTLGVSHQIDDPNQTTLPIEGDSKFDDTKITITTGETSVETTAGRIKQAAKVIKGKL